MINFGELLSYVDLPVHVIGAASAEGVAVTRLLQELEFSDVTVHDRTEQPLLLRSFRTVHGAYSRREQDELWERIAPVIAHGRFGAHYLTGMSDAALVVRGQGWYLDPVNRAAVEAAIPDSACVTSMTELYFALSPGLVAGITGTNGKSTTLALTDRLLETAGVAHRSAGNERSVRQFLHELPGLPAETVTLLEVSNRQLLQLEDVSPNVAAITELTPDHLEEHGGFEGYRATKAKLFASQREGDVAVINDDSPACRQLVTDSVATVVRCGIGERAEPFVAWLGEDLVSRGLPGVDDGVLATSEDLSLPGIHNRRNAAIAAAVALACGAPAASIAGGMRGFEGAALRLQPLGTVRGVRVVSDIKSTTPEATIAAVQALAGDGHTLHLICGGEDKGLDYAPLAAELAATRVRVLLVPGSATDELQAGLDERGVAWERCEDLEQALLAGMQGAADGDVMIVSPAAAGFWTSQLQGRPSLRRLVRDLSARLQEAPAG